MVFEFGRGDVAVRFVRQQAGKEVLHEGAVAADVEVVVLEDVAVAQDDDALRFALVVAFEQPAERERPFGLIGIGQEGGGIRGVFRPAFVVRPEECGACPVAGRRVLRVFGEGDGGRQ